MNDERWKCRRPEEQCGYVTPNGTDGYLCCGLRRGHRAAGIPHETHSGGTIGPWMTRAAWRRDFGEAARNCYIKVRRDS
jgi:hypothetical protein